MADVPSGTVTFLFTDIEGSTRLLARLRDRYAEVLAEHQRVLRAAFDEHAGREVHTEGDAFFVAFGRASDAVVAAVSAQRALASRRWPERVDVRVRMGVHTGQAEVRQDDYVGLDVHRAAQICAAGHGGQVLISRSTRELACRRYLALAQRDGKERALWGVEAGEHLAVLDAEVDNFDEALRWAVSQCNAELALALVRSLCDYWHTRNRFAVEWIDQALSLPDADTHPVLRTRALLAKIACLWPLGRGTEQLPLIEQAAAIADELAPQQQARTSQRGDARPLGNSPHAREQPRRTQRRAIAIAC
jgi:class 3 adenylate cyclase